MSPATTCPYEKSPKHKAFIDTEFEVPSTVQIFSFGLSTTAQKSQDQQFADMARQLHLLRRYAPAQQISDKIFDSATWWVLPFCRKWACADPTVNSMTIRNSVMAAQKILSDLAVLPEPPASGPPIDVDCTCVASTTCKLFPFHLFQRFWYRGTFKSV